MGALYALDLGNGKIKAGRAIDPDRRLRTHFKSFGKATEIVQTYVSDNHIEYIANETKLLQKFSRASEETFEAEFAEVVGVHRKPQENTRNGCAQR